MINEESIGVFQETRKKKWYTKLPKNVLIYKNIEDLKKSNSKSYLIISDKVIDDEITKK
jgi:hypothetical protein